MDHHAYPYLRQVQTDRCPPTVAVAPWKGRSRLSAVHRPSGLLVEKLHRGRQPTRDEEAELDPMGQDDERSQAMIAPGQTTHRHGRDPRNAGWSLCRALESTSETLTDDGFLGTGPDDCRACAEQLATLDPPPGRAVE